jgi:hypothetical protein
MFGVSFGGGKIDENCARLEASRVAPSLVARCKIFILNKYAKEAGVTMEDCLPAPQSPVVKVYPLDEPTRTGAIEAPATIIVPTPVVNNYVTYAPVPTPPVNIAVAARKYGREKPFTCNPTTPKGKNPCKPVITNDSLQLHQQ